MRNIFTEHPHSIKETYFQHLKFAFIFGLQMLVGGFACIIHAVFPFLFEKTGSQFLMKMMHEFVERLPLVEDERLLKLGKLIKSKITEKGLANEKRRE